MTPPDFAQVNRHGEGRLVTRFAPSPTGRLHLGHALSAVIGHRLAREAGGSFLVRIEDIDPGRAREEHVAGIMDDLAWLGLDWDGPVLRQSTRMAAYAAALRELRAKGLAYRCFCTRADIAAAAHASGPDGLLYPGTCRALAPDEAEARAAQEPAAWRLDMAGAIAAAGPLSWTDALAGVQPARHELFGDVVLARKDAGTSYHLAVVVDDAAQGVTDVARGLDLFAATHVHRLLQALLGLPTPLYRHHRLIVGADGAKLSKRDRAPTLEALRAAGADPADLVARLLRHAAGLDPIDLATI